MTATRRRNRTRQTPSRPIGRRVAVRLVLALTWLASGMTGVAAASDEPRAVDPPKAMFVRTADGQRIAGHVEAFSERGVTLRDRGDAAVELDWSDLAPAEVNRVYRGLLPKGDTEKAAVLLELAVVLRDVAGEDSRRAEGALKQAVRLDPDLADAVQAIRAGERTRRPANEPAGDGHDGDPAAPPKTDDDGHDHGPRISGVIQPEFWGELTPQVMADSVTELKAFVDGVQRDMGKALRLHETDYFLFYSDLTETEARQWAGLLDKMYGRLAELFAVPDGENIFRGKAVILVFRREADYQRFNVVAHQVNAAGSAGICYGFGDGHVHISFYRQPNQWLFAHILVHEAVHGFVHRYRSPERVPSWVNEGLAEYIATQLVPQAKVREARLDSAARYLRYYRTFGGMFFLPHIQGWQYGIALDLTEFMLGQSKKRYADFVNGIKDGDDWERSLNEHYGTSLERLIRAYERTLHLRDLSP